MALCRKSLGVNETGSLRSSFDTVRGETEGIAKAHAAIAGQMRRELEEPLVAFAGGSKERRKIIQNGIERLHKNKVQQTQVVNKVRRIFIHSKRSHFDKIQTRDRFEQDCLRIKGYLAQGHMVMGHEERKNKAKLEKTQIQLASSSNEYEAAVKILEETTVRWNKEWKAACDVSPGLSVMHWREPKMLTENRNSKTWRKRELTSLRVAFGHMPTSHQRSASVTMP